MATYVPPNPVPGGMPPKKKTSPLVWILVALGGVFLLIALVVIAGGLFVMNKARQVGLDPELMKKNPAAAMARLAGEFNPDVEVISADEASGVVKLKDKKTGKAVTINFEDFKKGKISFEGEGNEKVSIQTQGEGENATLEFRSEEGTARVDAGATSIPAWIPSYSGVKVENAISTQGLKGTSGIFHFQTKDAADKVVRFYESGLKNSGLKVTTNTVSENNSVFGGSVSAEDATRKVTVLISREVDTTDVNVTFETKD